MGGKVDPVGYVYISSPPLEPSHPSHLGKMGSELGSEPSQRGHTSRHKMAKSPGYLLGTVILDPNYFFAAAWGAGFATAFDSSGFVSTLSSFRFEIARNPSNPIPRIIADKLT